jgi:hypothetical protein
MRAFSNLAEAVMFLTQVISEGDYDTLAQSCRAELPKAWVLERLRERHESTPLPELYAGREFPQDVQQFKLGGHEKELGHIHIDFMKSKDGWVIQEIWMCR